MIYVIFADISNHTSKMLLKDANAACASLYEVLKSGGWSVLILKQTLVICWCG